MKLLITSSVLLFYFSQTPRAQQIELGGFVEIDHISYFKNPDAGKINSRNQAILQTEFRSSLSDEIDMFSAVEFRNDQSDVLRNRIYLDEAYIDYYSDNLDLRVGKQIINWGKADGVNPTDNLTPWDFSDILDTDDERIGVISAKADYYSGDWDFEVVLVPLFTASILPVRNSRWFPQLPSLVTNQYYPIFGPPFWHAAYNFADPIMPDENFKSAQFAGKVSSSLSGWDFSASYYSGYDDLPSYRQTQFVSNDTAVINFTPQYHRRNALGGDFSTTFGGLGVRGEAAYYFTADPNGTDPEIDDPYLQYVIGFDHTFSNIIGDNNLFALIQWIQEIPKFNAEYRADDLNHIFQKSISGRLEYELGAFDKIIFEGVYNVKSRDYYFHAGFTSQVTDGLELKLSSDILEGDKDTFFGSYRDNKRLQFRMKYNF
jgi:hypothetical protein